MGVEHGNAQPVFAVFFQKGFWEAGGFAAEDEAVIGRKFGLAINFWAAGFDEPEAGIGRKLCLKRFPVWPAMPFDMLPVVHAGPFELGVVELKAERFDEVQDGFGRGAKAGDVAGVGRDFGFEEDDVH